MDGGLVGALDYLNTHLVRCPVLRADDRHLVDHSAAGQMLTLGLRHVRPRTAHVRLVDFNGADENTVAVLERLAEPVRQVPRCLLRDVEVPVQLHARHALEARQAQVDGYRPHLIAELRRLHDRPVADAEALAALPFPAPERHPVGRAGLDVRGAAFGAGGAVGPAHPHEPRLRRVIVREHLHGLDEAHALAEALAGCACHRPSQPLIQDDFTKK